MATQPAMPWTSLVTTPGARILSWQLIALFLSCLTVALAVLLALAATWDGPHRVAVVSTALAVTCAASGTAWWVHRRHIVQRPIVFAQTVEELRRDAQAMAPRPPRDDDGMAGVP